MILVKKWLRSLATPLSMAPEYQQEGKTISDRWICVQYTHMRPEHKANIQDGGKTRSRRLYISAQKASVERGGGGRSDASPTHRPIVQSWNFKKI
jgi:hypothetical protein